MRCDECGRESNDTMEMTVARLTNEVELSKRVVTAHRKLCDERAAKIKELEAALAEAEAIVEAAHKFHECSSFSPKYAELRDTYLEKLYAARREKGGVK